MCQFNGPFHAEPRSEISRPEIAIPAFQRTVTFDQLRLIVYLYISLIYVLYEKVEAIYTV